MTNNLTAHVTSAISAIVGIVALVHPGFTLSPAVQGITVAVCAVIAGAIQLLRAVHTHKITSLATAISAAQQSIEAGKAAAATPPAA